MGIINVAKEVFALESREIVNLSNLLTVDFEKTVNAVLNSNGKFIISGMGKSGIKGKKIAATLASTDIHEPYQAKPLAEVVDILQIPAFLCRQTELLVATAKTDKIVNIKKAQFLDGKDMIPPVVKVRESGNDKIILTERGSMFGLGNLVVDFRQIIDMKEFGYPVVMDVTHSTQKPSALGGTSGGDRKYASYMAKLANAVGVNGFFFEVHENPEKALSDGPNMVYLKDFSEILKSIK